VNRGRTPEVFVITNHPGKTAAEKDLERKRYRRLYRDPSKVVYTSWTFENSPRSYSPSPKDRVRKVRALPAARNARKSGGNMAVQSL
jgi:hypothetical protein